MKKKKNPKNLKELHLLLPDFKKPQILKKPPRTTPQKFIICGPIPQYPKGNNLMVCTRNGPGQAGPRTKAVHVPSEP